MPMMFGMVVIYPNYSQAEDDQDTVLIVVDGFGGLHSLKLTVRTC